MAYATVYQEEGLPPTDRVVDELDAVFLYVIRSREIAAKTQIMIYSQEDHMVRSRISSPLLCVCFRRDIAEGLQSQSLIGGGSPTGANEVPEYVR